MKLFFILIIVSSFLISSCVGIFATHDQKLVITTNNPSAAVYVDSTNVGNGDKVEAIVERDRHEKQFMMVSDSTKPLYQVAIPTKTHWLYYLDFPWIVTIIGIYVPMFDGMISKCNVFKENWSLDIPYMYRFWDSSTKKVYIDNVCLDIKKGKSKLKSFTYNDYLKNDDPIETKDLDSLVIKHSNLDEHLEEIMKKTYFQDSVPSVFIDNINTYYFKAVVKNVNINDVADNYMVIKGYRAGAEFMYMDMECKWIVEDTYGDTVYVDSIASKSGQIGTHLNKWSAAVKLAMEDALETSLIKFMETTAVKELLKKDTLRHLIFDKLTIPKPSKTPSNIDDAMKATVTIKIGKNKGHGSGFFISNDGYIITNHHVANKKLKLTVITSEGTEYEAKLIRSNKVIDLAILKIEGKSEFAYNIPAEKNFKTGQEIFAIGTPKSIELGQSISKGIISSLRKNKDLNFLQIDASINRGNSGGPITNTNGDLLGVVESKLFGVGTEGISFSIPAFDIMNSLSISY
ncbi:MAG: trypsin-like peptidase domain-containing protein [Candidatus Kapabacteria bacterium]|nr:trypsin-like peptidase domain-containing protein [Candidatus Kapabacteria bacterium]